MRLTQRGRVVFASLGVVIALLALVGAIWLVNARGSQAPERGPADDIRPTNVQSSSTAADPIVLEAEQMRAEAERLRTSGENPASCVVEYVIDAVPQQYTIETEETRFKHVPLPRREGLAFAGWYTTPEAAAATDSVSRVNGARPVACADSELTLYGSFVSRETVTAAESAIPILMYHQFTTNPDGEDHWLRANYAFIGDFDAHLAYIREQAFYLPTWDELSAFIDGDLLLPDHSVIVTDDDAHETWFGLAVPVVDAHQVMTTSFVITGDRPENPSPSDWVLQRSHTDAMHWGGGDNGQGAMTWLPHEQVVNDLRASTDKLGAAEVFAYPFGHYNDAAKAALIEAGFTMARTVEDGYVRVGTDKLALPVIRINYGMGVDALAGLIG